MPTPNANVGALCLPLPATRLNEEIPDPTVLGIADFLRFTLRNLLNARLAMMQGTSSDAVPEKHVFPYDPAKFFVRNNLPALYVWWTGKSARTPWTIHYDVRLRQIRALYIFDELVAPGGLRPRHGLMAAVDAAFQIAAEEGSHPEYGDPPGTPLIDALGLARWTYDGGEEGFLAALPPATGDLEGASQRGFPSLQGTFTVLEKVMPSGRPISPEDDNRGVGLSAYTTETGPLSEGLLLRRKYIPAL